MIAELAESELDELAASATSTQLHWCATFITAALDEAPGHPSEDDVEDAVHDGITFLLVDHPNRGRLLERRWCPNRAGRTWARIRNGSGEVLESRGITRAARDLGRIRLG